MAERAVHETDLPLKLHGRGKVRDVYALPNDAFSAPTLLIVATDRLSAFDVVLPTPIPGKGAILNRLSLAWLDWIEERGLARTHVLARDADAVPGLDDRHRDDLRDRAMVGRRCDVVPIECVVRGYLDGSGWHDYQATGSVCGVTLPPGLQRGDRLPEPIFTPATKAERGDHDENISIEQAAATVGLATMERLRDLSLSIYNAGAVYATERGLILADTKFEFGWPIGADLTPDDLILVDEALTPDSSRYWDAETWSPGGPQPSFDKQFVRDHLQGLVDAGAWDKSPPGPELPESVVRGTIERYREAVQRLFGLA
jgi:phosphoribosylaminoimidazole-succinocarboxamide synthase